jgi:hypothetical protein
MKFPNSLNFNIFMVLYHIYKKQSVRFFTITWQEDDQVSNAKMWKQGTQILKLLGIYLINPEKIFNREYSSPTLEYSFDVVNKEGYF